MRYALPMGGLLILVALPARAGADVTFNKDVLPILQEHCQTCHRPGEVAPMSLLTYAAARPWARAIRAAVLSQKMPPWPVEPQYDHSILEVFIAVLLLKESDKNTANVSGD